MPAITLLLGEKDVENLLTMDESISALDELFHQESQGQAENMPTTEFHPPQGAFFRIKSGAIYASGIIGMKTYNPRGSRMALVYETNNTLDAIVDAIPSRHIRTGA